MPTLPNGRRAALYLRESQPGESSEVSLETQEAGCRAWCTDSGHAVVAVYREVRSGVDFWQRVELQRLLADAERGAFELVVFYATDRLSRDPEHVITAKTLLALCRVELACVTEPMPADHTASLVSFVRGWAAQREWGQIRERTLRGKRAKVERGQALGSGVSPYGYHKVRESGSYVVNEAEAVIVRRIFDAVADGESIRAVARALNAEGVPPSSADKVRGREAARWGPSQIYKLLRNPLYAGEAYGWRWERHGGRAHQRPRSEWVRLADDAAPALVDQVTWEAAQRRLSTNRGAATRNASRPALLRGLVRCAVCGEPMYPESSKGHRYYRCSSRDKRRGDCGGRAVRADRIEDDIWRQVERFLLDPSRARDYEAALERGGDPTLAPRLTEARARLAGIDADLDQFLTGARRSGLRWELVERQVAAAERERRAEERVIADLEQQQAAERAAREQASALADWCARAAAQLATFDFTDRRRTLEALEVRVVANGRSWWGEPGWVFGDGTPDAPGFCS